MSKPKLVVYKWVRADPYPKWWQFWRATHIYKAVGKIKMEVKK